MKIRCRINVNDFSDSVVLAASETETPGHMALRLAAFVLFCDYKPILDASLKHPALANQEFLPDLLACDECGGIVLWVECGKVALHKLSKIARRLPETAKIVVLKENKREALQLRQAVDKEIERGASKIKIICWKNAEFGVWANALHNTDAAYIFGEAGEMSMNLVINDIAIANDFIAV